MKNIYVTSVDRFSGKTAVCLALGKRLQAANLKVGYLKPLSLQPWRVGQHWADEDAGFVKEVLGLEAQPWEMSPVVVTPEGLRRHLSTGQMPDRMPQVLEACKKASQGMDVLILEGGGSLREGYTVGLATPAVAETLGSDVLAIVKYPDDVRLLDDVLTAQTRLGDALKGVIINHVPEHAASFVEKDAVPFLEDQSIPVFGVLPEQRGLEALTLSELFAVLDGELLTETYDPDALVETLTVGAMTSDVALSRFRRQKRKAVITGGDRADIQLAALETSTTCIVLTGNLQPSPLIVKQAEESGVAVILVRQNTLETVEAIDQVFGKTRMGQKAKLDQFEALVEQHVDLKRLDQAFDLDLQ